MGLYDGDGGIGFAQEEFRNARDRAEKAESRRRKQDRKDKVKDFILDRTLSPFGDFLETAVKENITNPLTAEFQNKSALLDNKNIPLKVFLDNFTNNQLKYSTSAVYDSVNNPNGYIVDGKVDENKYKELSREKLYEAIAESGEFPGLKRDNASYATFINSLLEGENFKNEIALAQKAYDESLDVPDMVNIMTDASKYLNRINGANPFQRFGNFARRVVGIETPETLDYKNLQTSEGLRAELAKIYGDNIANEMSQLNEASKKYQETLASRYGATKIDSILLDIKKEIESGTIKGKITKINAPVVQEINNGYGTNTVMSILVEGVDPFGNPTATNKYDNDSTITGFNQSEQEAPTPRELADAKNMLVSLIRNPEARGKDIKLENNFTLKQIMNQGFDGNDLFDNEVFNGYVDRVAATYTHLKRYPAYEQIFNSQGVTNDELMKVSAQFIINQVKLGANGVNPLTGIELDRNEKDNLTRGNNTQPYLHEVFNVLNSLNVYEEDDVSVDDESLQAAFFRDILMQQNPSAATDAQKLLNVYYQRYNALTYPNAEFEGDTTNRIKNVEDLPEDLQNMPGETAEEKINEYLNQVILVLNSRVPPQLRNKGVMLRVEELLPTTPTLEPTSETTPTPEPTTTPTPTPTPTPSPQKQVKDMNPDELESFVDDKRGEIITEGISNLIQGISTNQLRRNIDRVEKAISNIENNKSTVFNSANFRDFVEEQTGERYDFNMSRVEQLPFLKDYLLALKTELENK
jgi:hypothetical protein